MPSTISAVRTYFGQPRSVWVIFKCKIIKTPPQAKTGLSRPKHVWMVEMRARHHVARARSALKNFSKFSMISF
ncbi:hypothetical protein RHMOL_Rhmol12G0061500 [Rhododendron molle]|uniref:Uncharacterized protein n=1 Tax=Rhododendron molle TaxID=49168 RepID=A0ACC0LES3_RHOML|nr:hypothetical protein RHMOL_Rhmol12G0061500 [Rhododendron molle]